MPYVSRNELDVITGVFNLPQPGMAEEYLEDEDPELEEFFNRFS